MSHESHELAWTATGRAHIELPTGDLVAHAGQAVWIPAGHEHRVRCDRETLLLPVWLPRSRQATPTKPCTIARTPALDDLVRQVLSPPGALTANPRAGGVKATRALLHDLAETISAAQHTTARMPTDPRALRVAQALLADPADRREVDEWANEVGLSGRSLQRLFTTQTGLPLMRWRVAVRMQRAADDLARGAGVAEAAERVGFASASAFRACFEAHFGQPPSRCRP